ncbi:hypothetical protein [Muricoccus aerilatus]|uniref:hypothetical protein n=1 Tax=Muricoccus aerilatus TaxID=452982 RepID=UPI0005C17319|nr:hypothetical protein [Roseomonas aerilata]
MPITFLRRSVFLLVALFAVRTTPVSALESLAEELQPLLTTGTSAWVLAALFAALLVSHPGLQR